MTADVRTQAGSSRVPFAVDAFGRALRRYAIFIILAALVVFFHQAEPAFLHVKFARGVKLGAAEAGVADKVKVYSADVSTADIQEIREPGSSWVATSATNPAVVGEVSLRTLALLIAGPDPGKVVEVKLVLITLEALEKNDIKTVQDLDKKLPGFGVSDLATASWLTAPVEKTQ